MEEKDANQIVNDNSANSPPPPIQQELFEENLGYNCTECSSVIEILNMKEDELEFKCEKNDNHNNKLKINEYLEKMKKYIDNRNLYGKCEIHIQNEYEYYCLDCKLNLCKDCNKKHKKHTKKILMDLEFEDEELTIINNKIKNYQNKINDLIKENENKKAELIIELKNN